jgi:hypothetical protein
MAHHMNPDPHLIRTPDTPHTWRQHAACAGHDTRHWFAHNPGPAIRICHTCPVAGECLADAMWDEHGSYGSRTGGRWRHGVRGGLTAQQRADLTADRHTRRKAALAESRALRATDLSTQRTA